MGIVCFCCDMFKVPCFIDGNCLKIDSFNNSDTDRFRTCWEFFISVFADRFRSCLFHLWWQVQDLLNPSETDLPIREDGNHNIFVAGLTEKVISNFDDFKNLFGPASNNRWVDTFISVFLFCPLFSFCFVVCLCVCACVVFIHVCVCVVVALCVWLCEGGYHLIEV